MVKEDIALNNYYIVSSVSSGSSSTIILQLTSISTYNGQSYIITANVSDAAGNAAAQASSQL